MCPKFVPINRLGSAIFLPYSRYLFFVLIVSKKVKRERKKRASLNLKAFDLLQVSAK